MTDLSLFAWVMPGFNTEIAIFQEPHPLFPGKPRQLVTLHIAPGQILTRPGESESSAHLHLLQACA